MSKLKRKKAITCSLIAGLIFSIGMMLLLITGMAINAGNSFALNTYSTLANAEKLTLDIQNSKQNTNGAVEVSSANVVKVTAKYYAPSCGDSETTTSTLTISANSSVRMEYERSESFNQSATDVPLSGTWDFSQSMVLSVTSTTSEDASATITIKRIWIVVDNSIILLPSKYSNCSAALSISGITYTAGEKVTTPNTTTSDETDVLEYNQCTFSDIGSFVAGNHVQTDNYLFMGWGVYNSSGYSALLSDSISGEVMLTDYSGTWYLTPVFLPSDAKKMYSVGGEEFYFLDEAINAASSSNPVILINSGDALLTCGNTVTIPNTVTFVLPYSTEDTSVKSSSGALPYANYTLVNNSLNASSASLDPEAEGSVTYTLTVPADVTIVNSGKIAIGGTISSQTGVACVTSGAHSNLVLNGTLKLNDKSVLSVCGYILGNGTVNAETSTANIYQPFVVLDFRAAAYTIGAAGQNNNFGLTSQPGDENSVSPFNQYTMRNIQSKLILGSKATLYAYIDLHADGTHNTCTPALISSTGMIRLTEGATLTAIYDADKYVPTQRWIGRTSMVLSGDASFNSMTMSLKLKNIISVNINTASLSFPLPYNFDILLTNGDYSINNALIVLPGANLTVDETATLTVPDSSRLTVLDTYEDVTFYTGGDLADAKTMTYHFLLSATLKATDTIVPRLLEDYGFTATTAFLYSGNEAFIYGGTISNGDEAYMTKHGHFVEVTKSTYKTDSSSTSDSNTKTMITKAVLTDYPDVVIYNGLDIVSTAYLSYKAVDEYDHPIYGRVVAEYGTYTDTFSASMVYKVKVETTNDDGSTTTSYVYKWHTSGFELFDVHFYNTDQTDVAHVTEAEIDKLDANGNRMYAEEKYAIVYARYKNPYANNGTVTAYSSPLYHPFAVAAKPSNTQVRSEFKSFLNSLYGEGNYTFEAWYATSDTTTPKLYKLTVKLGETESKTVYYYKVSNAEYTEVSVALDAFGQINEISYIHPDSGETAYYLLNTIKYEFRNINNAKQVSEHYNQDGENYYRYASSAVVPFSSLHASGGKILYVDYTVPKTTEQLAPEIIFEGVAGSDLMPALTRVSVATVQQYELVINGKEYGKVYYEYIDAEGNVLMYYVYQDSESAAYIWNDGSYVTATTGSYKVPSETNPDTQVTINCVTKVTRASEIIYVASVKANGWIADYASATSTIKVANVSTRYPSAYALGTVFDNPTANLIVNGKLILSSGSMFGGLIQTDGGEKAILSIDANAKLGTKTRTGGIGYYAIEVFTYSKKYLIGGATYRELPASIYDSLTGELVNLSSGTYYGTSAKFLDIPFAYTLYDTTVGTGTASTANSIAKGVAVSGELTGHFRGEWYSATNDVYEFEAIYRLNDYIWLNASFKVSDDLDQILVSKMPANNPMIDLGDGVTLLRLPQEGSTTEYVYYLVRKVISTELTSDLQIQLKPLGDGFIADGSFERVLETLMEPDPNDYVDAEAYRAAKTVYDNKLALIESMLVYGAAADTYFDGAAWEGDYLSPPKDEEGKILWAGHNKGSATYPASSALEGITIRTSGVNGYFDNRIGFTVWFALKNGTNYASSDILTELEEIYGEGSIMQIGLLVGDATYSGELKTDAGAYTDAYLLYNNEELSAEDDNYPTGKLVSGTTQTTLSLAEIKTAMASTLDDTTNREKGCGISFDIKSSQYMDVFQLRLFVVLKTSDDTYKVLYGSQNNYSLPMYLNATFEDNSEAYQNFVCATWNYITAAEVTFPEA